MVVIKRGHRKIPEVREPEDQFMSFLISRIFGFTFSLYHYNMRDKQEGKVFRCSGIHSFLQKYY